MKAETEIASEENAIELGRRLAVLGAELLVETLARLAAGTIVAEKQDDAQATLAPLLGVAPPIVGATGAPVFGHDHR